VRVTGLLTLGGSLRVTNISGSLAAGDSLPLFQAGSYSGSFTNTIDRGKPSGFFRLQVP